MKPYVLILFPGLVLWNAWPIRSQSLEAPSGSGAWLWSNGHAGMDGIMFNYYFLHSDIYDELPLCVFQCMQIRECQSFTVENAGQYGYKCRFHTRRFSIAESTYLGHPMLGLELYMIHSQCLTSDSHFFSREAKMCVSVNVSKRKRQVAREFCVALGGDLVIIDTAVKEAFIADVLSEVSSWSTICFHTDARAIGGVYRWHDGTDVSSDLLTEPYDPLNECVEVIYDSPGQLTGQVFDCDSKLIRTICEYPI